jgi:diguanylate cyclase (GGDEF)-like protein
MGLRLQGLIWTLGLSLGLGGLGLGVLTLQLQQSFAELELEALRRDALRLQAGLAEAVAQRGRGAREWSHWTEMRDFVLHRDPGFVARNLTSGSVATSGLAWVLVLDAQSQTLASASADGSELAAAALLDPATARGRRLLAPAPLNGLCALDRWRTQLLVICQLPIRDSEGRDEPSGMLLTGEPISELKLAELRSMLGLRFDLLPPQPDEAGTPFESGGLVAARLLAGDSQHRLQWPLRVADEPPHSLLRLDWPREMRLQTQRVLRGAQAVMVGVAFLLAVAALVLIEFRLVLRLRRLQRRFAELRSGEHWQQRLPVDGKDEVAKLAEEGNHLLARIEQQVQSLESQSRTDALTGLANRRGFEEALQAALARAQRSGQPLSLLLLDADHFKAFNDCHGHLAGDRALQTLAQGLREGARRAGDLAARWGGEEFVLLLEACPPAVAAQRYEALQQWLRAQRHGGDAPLAAPVTLSCGLALARPEDSPEQLMQRADAALYRAKQGGRDRLACEP